MDQPPGYREGIEDSIRRCEELLALTPLALETSPSGLRRSLAGKERTPESSKEVPTIGDEDEPCNPSAEELWRRNMDLLIRGAIKTREKFQGKCDPEARANTAEEHKATLGQSSNESTAKSINRSVESSVSYVPQAHSASCEGTHSPNESATKSSFGKGSGNSVLIHECESEWSRASSEWVLCQDSSRTPESQLMDISQSSRKSSNSCESTNKVHVVLPLDPQSSAQSPSVELTSGKERSLGTKNRNHVIEITATRILDSSEGEVSNRESPCNADSLVCGHRTNCSSVDCLKSENERSKGHHDLCKTGSHSQTSLEGLQAATPDGSGISHIALGVTWDTSDMPTSPESEQRKDTASNSEENTISSKMQQHGSEDAGWSKSVPKGVPTTDKLSRHQRSRSVSREWGEDRLQTLARPRTEVYKKLAELKALLEREKLQQCSFKPLVGRKPDPDSIHSAPIFERIMELQQRFGLRQRARKAYEKEVLDNCSFWPRINFRSQVYDKITYQPIQDRFQELQRQKFEKIASAQLRKDMGLTFKPEINQKSIQLCKQKGLESINVADRLSVMQPSVHLDCKLEPQKHQSTFAPEINKNTDYIIASSKQFKGCSAGFLERQRQFLQALEEKKRSKEQWTADLPFRPDIGNSILILKQSHSQDVLQESPLERFERLAYKDKEQLCQAREKASEAYYSQFHFHPAIDGFSRILARNNSVDELYKNEKGRKVKEALEQAAEVEFHQKCTFRPEVNSTPRKNEDAELKSMIMQRRQMRKDKTGCEQESRTLKELQELKECTFKPCVNPSPPVKEATPAIIKGLERHLQLQCIAKQMRREQEELERKVFFSHAYALPMRQYTIPRPFVLHTAHGRYQKRL